MEMEEEFDGFGTGEGLLCGESAVAKRAVERVDGPDSLDELESKPCPAPHLR